MLTRIGIVGCTVLLLALSACGGNPTDRAVSGGAIGAGVGAVGGAVLFGSPLTGAAVGGTAGAALGALTDQADFNLGKPIWE